MWHVAAQIPRDQIAWRVIFRAVRNGQRFSLALKEDHQIRHAAMVNVRVRMRQHPAPLVRISREILHHVLVNFFLQVDTHSAIRPNDFVSADSRIGRHIAARIGNTNILRHITHSMMRALDRSRNQAARELFMRNRCYGTRRRDESTNRDRQNPHRFENRSHSSRLYVSRTGPRAAFAV